MILDKLKLPQLTIDNPQVNINYNIQPLADTNEVWRKAELKWWDSLIFPF